VARTRLASNQVTRLHAERLGALFCEESPGKVDLNFVEK
jgi:hypothetical protein